MIQDLYHDVVDPPSDRCPVCNKDLRGYSYAYRRKHIERCMSSKPKYLYSDRPRGRPSKRCPIKSPSKSFLFLSYIK